MNFLKRVLSTVVGIFVFIILILIFFLFVGMLLGNSNNDKVKIADNSVLQIQLGFPLKDNAGKVHYKDFSFLDHDKKEGVFDLISAIDYAAHDPRIKEISITGPDVQAGFTQLKNLREALERFKASGKKIKAYANVYTQKDYYLSAVADSIFISPVGQLDFRGLSTELYYLKDLQEKSGVKMEVIRMGKYKSAVEPFLENTISKANKEQVSSYLNSIWDNVKSGISESRDITTDSLNHIADNLLARTPDRALKVGLIDKIGYYDEYENGIKRDLGLSKKKEISYLSLRDYTEAIGPKNHYRRDKNKIAVIYAQGEISDGKGSVDEIGVDALNRSLKKAAEDKAVKAIVLRINSPGGSAMASDLIWRAVKNAEKEKPVIVSMGDVAASGGYYIASGADQIFAEPTTITGSIGVFGTLPNFKGLADKIGVHAQQVKTNPNAISYSPFEEMTEDQYKFILEGVKNTYHLFKTRVAHGRKLPIDSVEQIAQGRVWTGEQALKIGLVDQLGGMQDALDYAAGQAGISSYQIREYPVFKVDLKEAFQKYKSFGFTGIQAIEGILGKKGVEFYQTIAKETQREGVQALLPYSTKIH